MSNEEIQLPELKIPAGLAYPKKYANYFEKLIKQTLEAYQIAIKARRKGYDPEIYPEISLAYDLASRVEAMVGPKGIATRIRELQQEGKELEEIAAIIAREIALGKWTPGIKDKEKIAEQALRTSLAIVTNGIVAAPLEGIVTVKIRTDDNHLAVYYAGPIRSAGGTETALSVLLADIIRRAMGLNKYEPTEKEIERMIEEVFLYDRIQNLQHAPNREEIIFAMRHLPIEINGEGTDKEVQIHRKVKNVDTPKIRSGAVLVLNDGFIAKAKKLLKIVKRLNIDGWDWLEELAKIGKKSSETQATKNEPKDKKEDKITPNYAYANDVVIGRPILASPMKYGGFRLRYGRARNTGLAAVGIHPVTMIITGEFLAVGTQIKPERPGKGAIVTPVDSIEPPIVLLENGDVIKVKDISLAKNIRGKIKRILFLGDMLISIGEFLENNHIIAPSPIVEEWWIQELRNRISPNTNINEIVERVLSDPNYMLELSKRYGIPWHPKYTYFWKNITLEELIELLNTISKINENTIPTNTNIKHILEKLLIPHKIRDDSIILDPLDFKTLKILSAYIPDLSNISANNALDALQKVGLKILDKYTLFIGARMGRPEKAKPRKMQPDVHVLFPMGEAGQRTRSVMRALDKFKTFRIEAASMYCEKCGELTFYPFCPKCGSRTIPVKICKNCGSIVKGDQTKCPRCGSSKLSPYKTFEINFRELLEEIQKKHNISLPQDLRCVIGLISKRKLPEYLAKGVLRARHGLSVFRDGTIRFDGTDIPLTHFRPAEIGVSIEKLRELGYTHDINGKELIDPEQVVELMVQDIIINESAAKYLLKVANFIDELLVKVYGLEPYYNAQSKEDLIGHLVIGLAPHTSAGIIGRIIGFTKARGIIAHPYWHAAKRRNCDGDEDSIMLLLDGLLNFSKSFLPKSRGGQMDAPLIVTIILNPLEVDSEVYNLDVMKEIPLEFYRKSQEYPDPGDIEDIIENVEKRLGTPKQYEDLHFLMDTSRIDAGPIETSYVRADNMIQKLEKQIEVMKLIDAVDFVESIAKILESHVLRDIFGNLRSFGTQTFKCTKCNSTYRRMPLSGKCPKCGNPLKPAVYKNMVLKYFTIAREIIENLDEKNFQVQQFRRFLITDFKAFSVATSTSLAKFMNGNQATRSRPKDVKVVIKNKKIKLDTFI